MQKDPRMFAAALAIAAALSAPAVHATPTRPLTADELVARHVDASGGAAKWRAIRSLRLVGRMRLGDEQTFEAEYAELSRRPGQIRREVTIQGLTAVDAFDGADAWSLAPFGGRRDAQRTAPDEARGIAHEADFEGPLLDHRAKGHTVEYLGTEDVDGTPAHKLRLTRKDGDVEYHFLDPDSFLAVRITTHHRVRGAEHVSETDLGEYAQVAGVWLPMSIESGAPGERRSMRLHYDRVEANVDADDALFRFPAAGTPIVRSIVAGAPTSEPAATPPAPAAGRPAPTFDAGVLSGLGARNIGAAIMSGRIAAIAARNERGKTTIFVGAASGGVWRSEDGGTTFKPVFDKMPVQSIGALAIDPSNPKIVWAGTGEAWTRNSTSFGDGIYKSVDGGESWTNAGLPNAERVVRVIVHPSRGDTVYACVPGRLWSDSPDRGVYKTTDGGKTWALVLKGQNLSTGCSGLAMDPKNPEVLLAGLWDFRRKGWTFRSGGDGEASPSGSALHRTTDGGKTWTELTSKANAGLPERPWGRVEVAIAPSDPKVVYALIESRSSSLYRSSDGGATWEARDRSQGMIWRPFYFARLVVDPRDPDRLFKPGGGLIVSEDGGKSFGSAQGGAHGDWHDLWIDPDNPKHVVGGDDGGLWISWDGGSRWWKGNNLPISQFYHVALDDRDPYRVYGGLQDNTTWIGPSAQPGGIGNDDWQPMYNGDGFWAVPDPTDPEAVYVEAQGGFVARFDRRTGAARDIQPKAGYGEKLRFNWNTPIHASPTQKGTIYIGAQFLFRSRDRGDTWERVSPDLTTNDPEKQKQEQSGGVTVDNSSAEMHTTIYSISESPLDASTIWVGTDDGNLQLTRDAGKTWTNVAPNVKGLPKASWVSWVEASRFAAGTAYAAFDRHTFGDFAPWVFRTTDFGKTWTRLAAPEQGVRGWAHCVKEDVVAKNLVFVGTESGLFVSIDGGASFVAWKGGDFPAVPVREIQIHPREHDLVIATHGRGIWIVDDLSPLRALSPDTLGREVAFLAGRPAQQRMPAQGGWVEGDATFVGENPPGGAVITYYQRARHLFGRIKLEVLDKDGKLVDTLPASKRRGINRVTWSMQVAPPRVPRAATIAGSAMRGPRVLPGTYTVRLTRGADVVETKLQVDLDRRAPWSAADRAAQFEAAMRVHGLFGAMSEVADRIQQIQGGALARAKAVGDADPLAAPLRAVAGRAEALRKKIVATKEGGAVTGEERLREHADYLYSALLDWEGRPARYQLDRIDALRRELDDVRREVDQLVTAEVRPLDEKLRARKLEPIAAAPVVTEPTEADRELAARALACARGRLDRCAPATTLTTEAR